MGLIANFAGNLMTWAHVICMVGATGVLLGRQVAVAEEARKTPVFHRSTSRIVNMLIGGGLLFGLAVYFLRGGEKLGPLYNALIGFKFAILIAVGGLIAMAKNPERGDTMRKIALILLLVASLLGHLGLPYAAAGH